jgi:AraC-like DNA-binding protein
VTPDTPSRDTDQWSVPVKPLARYASLSSYVELSHSLGIDPGWLMKIVGLDPAGLALQDRWVPAATVAKLLELSAAASGQEDFGLRLAERRRFSNLGPISLVVREEPDVRSALGMLIRYEHIYNESLRIRLFEANGLATIRVNLELGEQMNARQATELAVGALHRILRGFLWARWQPLSVHFTHDAPADTRTHRHTFGPNVEFQHKFTGLVFYASDLAAPNAMSDPLLRPYAQQLLESIGAPRDATMLDRVRELIEVLLPTGRCSVEQVARSLGVNRRTVHRHLASSGETFSTVLDTARVELAKRFMANPCYSLTEIAELLGFSALSAFSRWFRGQFGCSPRECRSRTQRDIVR